jgi:5-methylcytosine-specific restriction endonuclease McrA
MGRRRILKPICAICRQEKLPEEFGRSKVKKNGLTSYCKECMRRRARERYASLGRSGPGRGGKWKLRDPRLGRLIAMRRAHERRCGLAIPKWQRLIGARVRSRSRRFGVLLDQAMRLVIPLIFRPSCRNAACEKPVRSLGDRCLECQRRKRGSIPRAAYLASVTNPSRKKSHTPRDVYLASVVLADQSTKKRRRQARKRRQFVENVRRREVYERDDGRCWLCRKRVSFEAMTVDHVVPLSKGGVHGMSNVRCACRLCNSTKRDLAVTLF